MPLSEKHRAKLNEELDVERKLYGQTDKLLEELDTERKLYGQSLRYTRLLIVGDFIEVVGKSHDLTITRIAVHDDTRLATVTVRLVDSEGRVTVRFWGSGTVELDWLFSYGTAGARIIGSGEMSLSRVPIVATDLLERIWNIIHAHKDTQ